MHSHPAPPAPSPAPVRLPPATGGSSDRGDGTYVNPVLFADYSDPDALRVGDDYWLTSSSFNHAPGLPILHSRDLVNWTLVNHALPRLQPDAHFSSPRHGGGVWAPAFRFHAGKYWIFYPDPDFGLYVVTTSDPRGPWSDPICIKPGRGLIDPCPFWDDDGGAYLIHAWAKSRSGIKNRLTLHRLRPDNLGVADAGEVVIDGDQMPGWSTIEGPKLYKRNGWYYIFAPAGGVREGYQAVFRARSLRGPYESRIVLAQGDTAVNGPHQGAWVETPTGEHWFLHFQERPAFGRVVHLQPVHWVGDWPVMGNAGHPVATHRKPMPSAVGADSRRDSSAPSHRDGVRVETASTPGPEWQWQANPQPGWFAHTASGAWRLPCVPLPAAATLWSAGHLLMRKFAGPAFVATTSLDLAAKTDGDCAGLVIFGHDYAWLGLRQENGRLRLRLQVCYGANENGREETVATTDAETETVELRVTVDADARCAFAYRQGRGSYRPIGAPFHAKSSSWVGAKVGVFAAATAQASSAAHGHALVRQFEFDTVRSTA